MDSVNKYWKAIVPRELQIVQIVEMMVQRRWKT